MFQMTLEQVRDRLREAALYGLAGSVCQALASHLDAHFTQPAQAVDGWQPIETAPKDGTEVQIFVRESGEQFVAYWHKRFEAWMYATTSSGVRIFTKAATHWMPLPPPPAANGEEDTDAAR